jgi:isocitrate dehydrogenase
MSNQTAERYKRDDKSTPTKVPVTVAHGDGIGPEIMAATLHILNEAGASLDIETVEIGESVYKAGHTSGIRPDAWESLQRTGLFLKAPITTPQGGGYKSLNVTVRKTLGLYANLRPCVSYAPYVKTKHPGMDVVIVRENEEDLYAGIEHRQTGEVYQCLKLISRPGCEKIVRYAFEFARAQGRKKVTCFTKDNIMKLTDGLFHQVFDQIAKEYTDLENEHWIVDIGAAKLADTPNNFDVVVMPNLYGDILSDVAAQIAGSVGLAGSANIGESCAMFEAIHGSAPRRAGQNKANPSGLLQGALLMLGHIGQGEVAARIQDAWLKTLEDGYHTYDIATPQYTKETVGTKEFAQHVIDRLGRKPENLEAPKLAGSSLKIPKAERPLLNREALKKTTSGVDVFLHHTDIDPEKLGSELKAASTERLTLKMITNRGQKVWPHGLPETFCTDHWRCRFLHPSGEDVRNRDVVELLDALEIAGFDFIKTEHLCSFDGDRGFSMGQGE